MSSGNSTTTGYYVEARYEEIGFGISGPPQVGKHTYLSHKWKRVPYVKSPIGVVNDQWDCVADRNNVLTYPAARALMAWTASQMRHNYDVEFRLVKVKCESSYKITEIGHSQPERFDHETERAVEFVPVPEDEE
jgi:hypothetical protein